MNSRKVVRLFTKTLLVGAVVGLLASFFVNPGIYGENLKPFDMMELFGLVVFYIGYGLLFSVISQTGFFAYLFINRFGLGLFRSFWPTVQMLLIAFVVFDLVYFPYNETNGEVSVFWFILMSAAILAYGLLIAWIKAKETHKRAFVPALFLMVVMTSIEWVPGLRAEGTDYAWIMVLTLLACNTYQLLMLHRLNRQDDGTKGNGKSGKPRSNSVKKGNRTSQAGPHNA